MLCDNLALSMYVSQVSLHLAMSKEPLTSRLVCCGSGWRSYRAIERYCATAKLGKDRTMPRALYVRMVSRQETSRAG